MPDKKQPLRESDSLLKSRQEEILEVSSTGYGYESVPSKENDAEAGEQSSCGGL